MGKIKLISLPSQLRVRIKNKINAKTPVNREGATPYTYKEVYNYMRMYLSGYSPKVISEHYDVEHHRIYNALYNCIGLHEPYKQLRAHNAKKRRMGHKLTGVQEFLDKDLYDNLCTNG